MSSVPLMLVCAESSSETAVPTASSGEQSEYAARPTTLGDVLVRMGIITVAQMNHAIQAQAAEPQHRPFGQVLLSLKLVTEDDLRKALEYQTRMKGTQGEMVGVLVDILQEVQLAVLPAYLARRALAK